MARTLTHFPAFYYWIMRTANDPAAYNLLIEIAWKLALVLGCALSAEWVIFRLIRRPVVFLEGRVPQAAHLPAQALPIADPPSSVTDVTPEPELHKRRHSLVRIWQVVLRLPFVLARLVFELLPVFVFVGIATALLGTEIGEPTTVRLVILAVVNAYAFSRGLICVVRALAGPSGLFPVRAETAAYIEIWARRIVGVGVSGIAFANVALLLGLLAPATPRCCAWCCWSCISSSSSSSCNAAARSPKPFARPPSGRGLRRACATASPVAGITLRSRSILRCGRCGR